MKNTKWIVMNDTDGIQASQSVFTDRQSANDWMVEFPKRFYKQGYYKTAHGEKIHPDDIKLSVKKENQMIDETKIRCDIRELRIGNIIAGADYNSIVIVSAEKIKFLEWHPNLVMPMPLNEEWLIKLGFDPYWREGWSCHDSRNGFCIHNRNKRTSPRSSNHYFTILIKVSQYPYHMKIDFVHQLQNLFHAITQRELVYNPYNEFNKPYVPKT